MKTTFLGNFGVLLLFVDIRQGDCILSETASLKSVLYVKNGYFELKLGKERRPQVGEKERGFLTEIEGDQKCRLAKACPEPVLR